MAIARITEISASGLGIEDATSNGIGRIVKSLENVEQVWFSISRRWSRMD